MLQYRTGCSWKFGSNNEAIHTLSICRVYEEPVPAVINGLSISWVTESCWVGWLSGWTLRWSEAVPVRQPGDWYLCPYLSEKCVWAVLCLDFDDFSGAICDDSRMKYFCNLANPDPLICGQIYDFNPSTILWGGASMRPAKMFIWKLGRNNTWHRGRCEHATRKDVYLKTWS